MLNVTENAAGHLAQILEQAPEDAVVRFVPEGNSLALRLDNERPGDTTFAHGEKTVLALDSQVAEALSEKTLDVQPTPEGQPQLALQ